MIEHAVSSTRCGYVAIVGRPNVGKSTLINHILGQKLSITSRRPQTTRHQILGVKTTDNLQAIYVDTPGIHKTDNKKAINRYMNQAARSSLNDIDVVIFVVDRLTWTEEDELVLNQVKTCGAPVILAVNKIDRLQQKNKLIPWLDSLSQKMSFAHMVPIAAKTGHNLDRLERLIHTFMPESIHFFEEDQLTNRSQRFLAAELVREKIMRQLGDELPYQIAVEIESFKSDQKIIHIDALILVEKQGQKKIVIGEKGARLKTIGTDARLDMEQLFNNKVALHLWVKVRSGWSNDERTLQSLGYSEIENA